MLAVVVCGGIVVVLSNNTYVTIEHNPSYICSSITSNSNMFNVFNILQGGRENSDFVPCPESYQELTNGQPIKQVFY